MLLRQQETQRARIGTAALAGNATRASGLTRARTDSTSKLHPAPIAPSFCRTAPPRRHSAPATA